MKEILKDLRQGYGLTLSETENQHGILIDDSTLRFENGRWIVEELNCWGASSVGMGTCACNTHPTFVEYEVSRLQALKHIRKAFAEMQEEETSRQAEIAWLNEQIIQLEVTA